MNRKRAVSILAIIMAVVMILSLILSVLPRAYAVTQSEIDAVRAKKDELTALVKEAEDRLTKMQDQEATVLEKKAALDVENKASQEALALVAEELAMYDEIVAEKTEELNEALAVEEAQARKYRARIRSMEENGTYDILALILHASSFSELLSTLDDMDAVMESDKRLEARYKAARQEAERVKAEYEAVRRECEDKQAALRIEQAQIQERIEEANAKLEELADEIEEATKLYEEQRDAEQAADEEIKALIAEYEAQKRAEEEARRRAAQQQQQQQQQQQPQGGSGGDSGGGSSDTGYSDGGQSGSTNDNGNQPTVNLTGFTWPVPCSRRITGRYGESRPGHFHAGLDIDGYDNDGGSIVAAASGTVITSGFGSAYGNYVIIDHGNGYQTVYAHNSRNAVSVGQWVNAGDTVAYLGQTGNASGTHCHFEIRINGSTVDPAQYFSGLSYWNC